MTDESKEAISFPGPDSASLMEQKEAAIGAELLYVHNSLVAVTNSLIEQNNANLNTPEADKPENVANVGAINAFGFAIELVRERIKKYITNFDELIGAADVEPTISAPTEETPDE